jgi:predicted dehydrogenase
MFAIMYSERLEVRAAVQAGYMIKDGAIGKVVQTINIAPHQVNAPSRPDWFWDPAQYGGILCDIGSHQADQFVYYTGSTQADVTASQISNVNHSDHPKFQDFGDMMLHGNGGAGYVRVDWFTPDGLARGVMAGYSFSVPRAISNCANTSTLQGGREETTCSSWIRRKRGTSTATKSRFPSDLSLSRTS